MRGLIILYCICWVFWAKWTRVSLVTAGLGVTSYDVLNAAENRCHGKRYHHDSGEPVGSGQSAAQLLKLFRKSMMSCINCFPFCLFLIRSCEPAGLKRFRYTVQHF